MAFDDARNENRKQEILKKFIPGNDVQEKSAVEELAQNLVAPVQKSQDYFAQKSRNMQANALSPNVVGDVSEENLARMSASDIGLPQSPQNLEAMKAQYEPAFVGGISKVGKGGKLAEELAQNLGRTMIRPSTTMPLSTMKTEARLVWDNALGKVKDPELLIKAVKGDEQAVKEVVKRGLNKRALQAINENKRDITSIEDGISNIKNK